MRMLAKAYRQAGRVCPAEDRKGIMTTSYRLMLCMLLALMMGACSKTTQSAATTPPSALTPEQLYQAGRIAYAAERFDEAAENFARVVHEDPQHLNALINWGAALSRSGKPGEAIAKYQQAVLQDPNNAAAYYNWGVALERLGRHPEAVERYDKAIALQAQLLTPELERYLQRHRSTQQDTRIKSVPVKPDPPR
jgi:tetratricopeptide (TPR) repeat protein